MGRPIGTQKRGKGSNRYTAPSHRYKTEAHYRNYEGSGKIREFDNDPSKSALIMQVEWEDGKKTELISPEGVFIDSQIVQGNNAPLEIGSVMPLSNIPEGIPIFNIERVPGDGGNAVRAAGSSATIVGRQGSKVKIKLPSKHVKDFDEKCRATIGVVSGGGRKEKPIVKAGNAYKMARSKARRWPVVRGVAMNAIAHPHGGSQHHAGKPTTVKRSTSPGRKVGHIAAKRTGRRKR